jgi:hypothetical protein
MNLANFAGISGLTPALFACGSEEAAAASTIMLRDASGGNSAPAPSGWSDTASYMHRLARNADRDHRLL